MLDQNTDRMWFVIGAVIVGAAIIFIANGTIPEIFASVTDSFEESSGKATEVISDISPNPTDEWQEGLINKSNRIFGYYGITTGKFIENSHRFSTPFFTVPECTTHVTVEQIGDSELGYSNIRLNAFDDSKVFIGNIIYEDFASESRTYSIPAGTKYVVFGWMDMDIDYALYWHSGEE